MTRQKKIGRGGKPYTPAQAGDGVAFGVEKIKPGIMKRIDALGLMNDRRTEYVAAGDVESLLKLAQEYEAKKMPVMAEAVRQEAYEFGYKRSKVEGRRRTGGTLGRKAAGDVHAGAGGSDAGSDDDDLRQCSDPRDRAEVRGTVQRQGTSARVQRIEQRATGQAGDV